MDPVFKKLNLKDHKVLYIFNAPLSFEANIDAIKEGRDIRRQLDGQSVEFVMAFVNKQEQIDLLIPQISHLLKGDAILWMCYPKGTSKKYTCDFNRDTGWDVLGKYNLEGVRQVAIDEDWSALRFRKVDYIKTMSRKFGALSEKGKKKTGQ
jgi:hypothetical protein